MILNPEKCHNMCLGKNYLSDSLSFCGEVLEAAKPETVLVIQTDSKLNFENHNKSLKSLKSQSLPKTRGITKILKSFRCAKEKSSIQLYNKISVLLLPSGLTCFAQEDQIF